MKLKDRPAAQLEGMTLKDGWIVGKRIDQSKFSTGGNFSFGYPVEHPQKGRAFLKALDYSRAMQAPDVAAALKVMTDAYVHERDLLIKCGQARMSKVVLPLDHGQITVPGKVAVNYLIFEEADGDIRKHLAGTALDEAWAARVLHNSAVGVQQLHAEGIAHQDLKPSNVLTFDGDGTSKLADLGRAEAAGQTGPFSGLDVAGDPEYAPLEHLYGYVPADWSERRRACDLYHLGSLVLFLLSGTATTPAVVAQLDPAHRPRAWAGDYPGVLPFVRAAFDLVATDLEKDAPNAYGEHVTVIFRELCDPEPDKRGHPKARASRFADSFSVERYVSQFNLIAERAEKRLRQAVAP